MLKVMINVNGDDEESESELVLMIAAGLVKRGYKNMAVVAHGQIGMDSSMREKFEARLTGKVIPPKIDRNTPIATVTRTWH